MAAVLALGSAACPAVYPELKTPIRPPSGELEPPPHDLRWIAFKGATVPERTRDGRRWDSVGGEAPDPYAILYVNGSVLIKTPVEPNSLKPTWRDGPAGNFWLRESDRLRVELWDSNPINDHPIGVRDFGVIDEETRNTGVLHVETDTGAEIEVAIEPAHARKGLGFFYELRVGEVYVTRLYAQSPASRAGMRVGDQILQIGDRPVSQMTDAEVQSTLNVPRIEGIPLRVRHADGAELSTALKEGAIFPIFAEDGPLR